MVSRVFLVLTITLPVFALIFCGAAGQRFKLLPDNAVAGINAFVMYFALPCMLFRVVATAEVNEIFDWRFAGAYIAGSVVLFQIGRWASRCLWDNSRAEAYAHGTVAAHGNIGYLGIALVGELLGPKALPIVTLAILCDIFFVMGSAIVLYERDQAQREGKLIRRSQLFAKVLLGLLKSPIVTSLVVGLVWLIAELPIPRILDNFTRLLGAAAGTCALFAIGASLNSNGLKVDRKTLSLIGLKLIVHPAIAAVLLFLVFKVDPQRAAIGVLCASLPGASNTFIIAQRYGVSPNLLSPAIVAGTFISVLTVSSCIWMLNIYQP